VVCDTDVRGRHGDPNTERPEIEILNHKRDSDWEGLKIVPKSYSHESRLPFMLA
jgi:hypothetical protein